MGCDIHPYVEYKDKKGRWQPADIWVKDLRYAEDKEKVWRVPYHCGINRERHYNFFAWLADVRNGTWNEPMPVIFPPRGLPDDMSDRVKEASLEWDGDGHSHSWVTRQELQNAWEQVKNQVVRFHGAVDLKNPQPEFQKWLKKTPRTTPPPGGYCAEGTNCTHVDWGETVESIIGQNYNAWRDYLWNVEFEYQTKEVRVVFWFDN